MHAGIQWPVTDHSQLSFADIAAKYGAPVYLSWYGVPSVSIILTNAILVYLPLIYKYDTDLAKYLPGLYSYMGQI